LYLNGSSRTSHPPAWLAGRASDESGLFLTNNPNAVDVVEHRLGGVLTRSRVTNSGSSRAFDEHRRRPRRRLYALIARSHRGRRRSLWITSNTIRARASTPPRPPTASTSRDCSAAPRFRTTASYYRTAGAAFNSLGAGAYGLIVRGSSGIRPRSQPISNPSMSTSGNYIRRRAGLDFGRHFQVPTTLPLHGRDADDLSTCCASSAPERRRQKQHLLQLD